FGEGDDHVSPPIQAASLYTNSVPQYAKGGVPMAKVQSDSVYRIIDVVGVSETSWEDAGRKAVGDGRRLAAGFTRGRGHQDGYESRQREGHCVPNPRGPFVQVRSRKLKQFSIANPGQDE